MSFLVILTVILGFSSSFSLLEFSIVLELAELGKLSLPIGMRPGLTKEGENCGKLHIEIHFST